MNKIISSTALLTMRGNTGMGDTDMSSQSFTGIGINMSILK
jgi:hypothetical protein